MSNKIKVNREAAQAIESLYDEYGGKTPDRIEIIAYDIVEVTERYKAFKGMRLQDIIKAIADGYEIVESPEERIKSLELEIIELNKLINSMKHSELILHNNKVYRVAKDDKIANMGDAVIFKRSTPFVTAGKVYSVIDMLDEPHFFDDDNEICYVYGNNEKEDFDNVIKYTPIYPTIYID